MFHVFTYTHVPVSIIRIKSICISMSDHSLDNCVVPTEKVWDRTPSFWFSM